jgi:Zn-dependent peptidase ImmA (M78 family)
MATAYANVNPDLLRWARERADLSVGMLATKLQTTEDKVDGWETGERKITMRQAMKLANKTFVPFGYFFLTEPPVEKLPIPDLRTIEGEPIQKPSAELYKIIQMVLARQSWYKEYLHDEEAQPFKFVGKFNINTPTKKIVDDMRLCLDVPPYPVRGNWEDYLKNLIAKIESVGIMVMREGYIGHHTRPLSVKEFRGFAIADEKAPIIFVNNADAPAARLFTLIHELAHIWIGSTGVSSGVEHSHRREEILCNAIAAEFLVPETEIREQWIVTDNWKDNLAPLEALFKVSQWVLARRALTLNFITRDQYTTFIAFLKRQYIERDKPSGGPSHWVTLKSQTSERFARALLPEVLSGKILLRDAGQLLRVKPDKIKTFAKGYNF